MGSLKLSNNASSTLAGSITTTDTLLSVATGDGAKFPSLGTGDWHPATIVDASGNYEIVRVTARTGDVLTVTRAQEGTAGAAFASGCRIDLRMTAAAFESLIPSGTALLSANNLSDVQSTTAARTNLGLGDIATHNVSEFATAAQGAEADTAMQPFAGQSKNAAKVASTGAYADLSGTPVNPLLKANNLSDVADVPTARTNLGLGSAALKNVGGANGLVANDASGYIVGDGRNITNINAVPKDSSGAVGQFIIAFGGSGGTTNGTAVAGSGLTISDCASDASTVGLPGTWRCMGFALGSTVATLWQRIS